MKKALIISVTGILSFMLLAGCSGAANNPDLADKLSDIKETAQEQNTSKEEKIEAEEKSKAEEKSETEEDTSEDPTTESVAKSSLSKEELAEIGKSLGDNVCVLETHDYDGDGMDETFVVLGGEDEFGGYLPEEIWFVSCEGATELIRDDFKGLSLYKENDNFYMDYPEEDKGFFYGDCGGYGSGWTTFIFGVKDGRPYELDVSMDTEGFYQDEDKPGEFYTLTDNYDNGHAYLKTELIYNNKTGQFTKGKVSDENWAE